MKNVCSKVSFKINAYFSVPLDVPIYPVVRIVTNKYAIQNNFLLQLTLNKVHDWHLFNTTEISFTKHLNSKLSKYYNKMRLVVQILETQFLTTNTTS